MKKILFSLIFALSLFSCSNDDSLTPIDRNDDKNASIIDIRSTDDLDNFLKAIEDVNANIMPYQPSVVTRGLGDIEYCIGRGNNRNFIIQSNQQIRFAAGPASIVGVEPNKVYICDTKRAELDVFESPAFRVEKDNSPECGIIPGGGHTDIGYAIGTNNGKLIFYTYVIHVKHDLQNTTINRFYPRMTTYLVWNFKRISLY